MPLEFGLKDFIDIFLVALMLFYCYKVMKESRSLNVFFGVLIFVVFWLFVSQILEMKLLGSILDKLVSVGTLALIILFQEEIRNFFFTIGTHRQVESLLKLIRRNKKDNKKNKQGRHHAHRHGLHEYEQTKGRGIDCHRTQLAPQRYHTFRRTHRCQHQSTAYREHLFQKQPAA